MSRMPGSSYDGALPPLTAAQGVLARELEADVRMLSESIGERHVRKPERLTLAVEYVERELAAAGEVRRETYVADGVDVHNLVVELPGTGASSEWVVVGAHYDSIPGCPAANDNGSAVAGLLALARRLEAGVHRRPIRLVAFVNEEPPYFQGPLMGSYVHAKGCKARGEELLGMISLETIGCYLDEPKTQRYPWPVGYFYPDVGNFIAFVGNRQSGPFIRQSIASFRRHAQFPSEGASVPGVLPGIGWSDQWSFWQFGYQAYMLTDTAPFRYKHYHRRTDTWDRLDYERMGRVMDGMVLVVRELADGP